MRARSTCNNERKRVATSWLIREGETCHNHVRLQRGVARLERSFQRLLFAIVWVSVFVGVGAFCLDTRVGRSIAWMNSRRNRIHTEHSCFLLLLKWQLLDTPTSLHIFPAAIAKSCALRVACTICLSRRSKTWLLKLEKLRRREATPSKELTA